ncbi:MAG: RNA polymerase sigma factor [Pseudomonadota bacterium]
MSRTEVDSEENPGAEPDSRPVALLTEPVHASAVILDARPELAVAPPARGLCAEPSDQALVEAIRRGDQRLGRTLYARLGRVIDRTLTRVLGPNQPEHDDLVQAVFEEVLRTIFEGRYQQRCTLTSWAASIACHVGLNAIRTRKIERNIFDRNENAADLEIAHGSREGLHALEARDELRQVRSLLAQLSPGRAEAVLLYDAFGYDLNEVAALTSSTPAAVQSRLARGRKDLAELLAAQRTMGGKA